MLTAAEWNERHPPGSVVWYPTTDGPRLGMQWGIAADEFDAGPGVVLGRISSGLSDKIAPPFPLAQLEPVVTDEQRRAEGWLDPTGVEIVWDERATVITERDRAIAERDALLDALDAAKAHNDANCSSLHLLAAQQPVIDAARAWLASRSLVEEYNMDDDEIRLEAAVKALDAAEAEPC